MELDDFNELLDNLPQVKKDISVATAQNVVNIRKSMEVVLKRELDKDEDERLLKHSFHLALHQLTEEYKKGNYKLSNSEEKWRQNLRKSKA